VELNAGFKLLSTNEDRRQGVVVKDVVNTSAQGSALAEGGGIEKNETTSPRHEIKNSRLYSTFALEEATTPTYPTTTTVNLPGTLPTTKNVNSNLAPTSG